MSEVWGDFEATRQTSLFLLSHNALADQLSPHYQPTHSLVGNLLLMFLQLRIVGFAESLLFSCSRRRLLIPAKLRQVKMR